MKLPHSNADIQDHMKQKSVLIIESVFSNLFLWNRSNSIMKPRWWDGLKLQTDNGIRANMNAKICCLRTKCSSMQFVVVFYHSVDMHQRTNGITDHTKPSLRPTGKIRGETLANIFVYVYT